MADAAIETLEEKAERFLGRSLPLCETGIQSNGDAVFSGSSKGFGQMPDGKGKGISAKLVSSEGQIFFVPLEKVVDFFERSE